MEDLIKGKFIEEKHIITGKIPPPPIPLELEQALKEAKLGRGRRLDQYREGTIQRVVWGIPIEPNVLNALGISQVDEQTLREITREHLIKLNSSEFPFQEAAQNLQALFSTLSLDASERDRLTIFSFGCGVAPEATACLNLLGEKLERFVGYDQNQESVEEAKRRNPNDARLEFEIQDLTQQLPEGNPDLIIIRNPNVFTWERSGQNSANPQWMQIFENLRTAYPTSKVLITTPILEEITLVAQWLKTPLDQIPKNQYATFFTAQFGDYGRFKLPAAADQYYLLLSNPSTPNVQ